MMPLEAGGAHQLGQHGGRARVRVASPVGVSVRPDQDQDHWTRTRTRTRADRRDNWQAAPGGSRRRAPGAGPRPGSVCHLEAPPLALHAPQ
jgi:hypothetical protein